MTTPRRRLRTLAVLLSGLAGGALGATMAVHPAADAFVTTGPDGNLSGNNYGGAGALAISGPGSSKGAFTSVIRFDLASVKAAFDAAYGTGAWTVQTITLQLTSTNPNNPTFNAQSDGQFSIVWMADDGWEEGSGSPNAPGAAGITYQSLPAHLGAADRTVGTHPFHASHSGADGTLSLYALSLVGGLLDDAATGSLASFQLAAASDHVSYLVNSRSFGTIARRPLLTVEAVAVPEPATWLLIALAGAALGLHGRHASTSRNSR